MIGAQRFLLGLTFLMIGLVPMTAASFGGVAVTEEGLPVPGAQLPWREIPPCYKRCPICGLVCPPPTAYGIEVADGQGRFRVADVPAGEYVFCLSDTERLVGTCGWRSPDAGPVSPANIKLADARTWTRSA